MRSTNISICRRERRMRHRRESSRLILLQMISTRPLVLFFVLLCLHGSLTLGFLAPQAVPSTSGRRITPSLHIRTSPSLPSPLCSPSVHNSAPFASSSSTSLHVWWFGGSELFEGQQSGDSSEDSCELVPVRIERTSPNSRRILGEITAPSLSLQEMWSILTDYDRLSTHVPNLVESRILSRSSPGGRPGDGEFTCKLYQKGAQKIVGFEFGASVTMNMREEVVNDHERRIYFQCVDSFFFQEFDGEWRVVERKLGTDDVECTLSYVVDVRPKGPVPVAALEWRIREDVPTNLRAVKRAAMEHVRKASASKALALQMGRQALFGNLRSGVTWERSETMAAYLDG